MRILKDDAIGSKFLLDLSVHVDGIGNFHTPYVTNIVDMTEEYYQMVISHIFFDKKILGDVTDLQEFSNFETLLLIINQNDSFREFFFYALNLHLLDTQINLHPNGLVYFGEQVKDNEIPKEECVLSEEKFDYIKRLVRIANFIPEKQTIEEEYKAGNDRAKKFLEKLKKQREEISKVKKQKINLHSIISAVGWKSQSFDFISKLNIYQLYDGFYRLGVIDNYNHTMAGIYSGNVDGSKIKLDDINWSNIIKIK